MSKRQLNPPTLFHSTYSHAAAVEGGTLIVTAGQVAFDREGKVVGAGDIAAQTHQTYANLRDALLKLLTQPAFQNRRLVLKMGVKSASIDARPFSNILYRHRVKALF